MITTVGGHAQKVGDAVVEMGAEGVCKETDADMLQLRNGQCPFRPREAVIQIVGLTIDDGMRIRSGRY